MRLLITGIFGLSATFIGTDAKAPFGSNEVEACGVKVSVKAAPPKRGLRRTARRSRPVQSSGSRVAVRKKIDTKSDRTPIAAGNVQARPAPSNKRRVTKPKLRVAEKPKKATPPEPKAEPKETKVARVDTEPVAEPVEDDPPEAEPTPAAPSSPAAEAEVFFETGEFGLASDGESELEPIVEWLKANPRGKVVIEGHTDPVGSTGRNRLLSVKRAKAVQAFLASAAGVRKARLKVRGYGETKLRYPRNSPKNRRVHVKTR